jgi:hypothetical protein
VLIAVLMMLKLHRDILSPSVLGVLIREQVVVLIAVLMTLKLHCDVLSPSVLEVLVGEH